MELDGANDKKIYGNSQLFHILKLQ
jgi:hypothetical protein